VTKLYKCYNKNEHVHQLAQQMQNGCRLEPDWRTNHMDKIMLLWLRKLRPPATSKEPSICSVLFSLPRQIHRTSSTNK